MHYLIDGHNLIGQIPQISFEDPHDEVKLVFLLRRWAARDRKRRIDLFFDGGMPGGEDRGLSTSQVKVSFASPGRTADALIISKMKRLANPSAYTIVSNDQELLAAAERIGVLTLSSQAFAQMVFEHDRQRVEEGRSDDLRLSKEEIAEWLAIFKRRQIDD